MFIAFSRFGRVAPMCGQASLGVLCGAVLGADLTNNLANTSAGTELATSTRWLSASFATDGSTHSLSYVTLRMSSTTAGSATLMLYSAGGLEPSTLIATLAPPASYSPTLANTVFTASGVTLAANTTYWVVLKANSTAQFNWSWTGVDTGLGTGFQHTWGVSEDSGAFWWTQDVYPAQLSVTVDACNAPSVSAAPMPTTACQTESASFSTTAAGTGPLSYQWRRAGTLPTNLANGTAASGAVISGANTAMVTITHPASTDAGMYDCLITNSCGSAVTNSAMLNVCACLACPADFNQDGGVDGADVAAFFQQWETGNCDGDVNSDGGVDGNDVEFFFHAWVNGGC